MLRSNIIQRHVKSAFDTGIAIDQFIHCHDAFFNSQSIFSFQQFGKILPDNKTGILAFPVDGHIRAAFSKTGNSFPGNNFHQHIFRMIISAQVK